MKTAIAILSIIALLAGAREAQADCGATSLAATPPKDTKGVPLNVSILLEAYGYQRGELTTLLTGARLVAPGNRDTVPLKVRLLTRQSRESLETDYLILQPRRSLKANTRYTLTLLPSTKVKALRYWGRQLRGYRFTTGKVTDNKPPARPKLSSSGYRFAVFGCGPAKTINLQLTGLKDDNTDASKLGVVLDVKETLTSGKSRSFEVVLGKPYGKGRTFLGHGMCSGNYKPRSGATYVIRVRSVDWAGNRSAPSNAITATVTRP